MEFKITYHIVISGGIVCFSALVNDFTTYAFFRVHNIYIERLVVVARGAREATAYNRI